MKLGQRKSEVIKLMSIAEEIIAWLISRYFVAHGMTELLFLAVGGAAIAPPTSLIEDIVPGE